MLKFLPIIQLVIMTHFATAFVTTRFLMMQPRRSFIASTTTRLKEYGTNMDQQDMMESDMLIAVDPNDVVIDNNAISKKDAHTFDAARPRGILHRAFSFFLFDRDNKMLLTKRASTKITFPGVWTNTCCSHPLYNNDNEIDVDAYPHFPGIKNAVARKVKHEIGINDLPRNMTFITRFHYWASDTLTHGPESPWGEHEIDYILFMKTTNRPSLLLNPDEVAEYKYVSTNELRDMMADPNLKWSPWFRGITERGFWEWWQDMDGALAGKYTNKDVIYFDPPSEHVANYNLPSHDRNTGVAVSNK